MSGEGAFLPNRPWRGLTACHGPQSAGRRIPAAAARAGGHPLEPTSGPPGAVSAAGDYGNPNVND